MKRLLLPLLFTIHLTPYSNVFDFALPTFSLSTTREYAHLDLSLYLSNTVDFDLTFSISSFSPSPFIFELFSDFEPFCIPSLVLGRLSFSIHSFFVCFFSARCISALRRIEFHVVHGLWWILCVYWTVLIIYVQMNHNIDIYYLHTYTCLLVPYVHSID